jgi:hypothetical protein
MMNFVPKIPGFLRLAALIGIVAPLLALRAPGRADESVAPVISEHAAPEHAAAPANWDMSPYCVQLYFRIDAAPGWTAARRKEFIAAVANRAAGIVGGVWQVSAFEAPAALRWERASSLNQVALDTLPAAAMDCDKVVLLGLDRSTGREPLFWARELDVRTRLWSATAEQAGPPLSAPMNDVVEQAVRAAWNSFRPLARIETLADQGVTVRIRGGGLPAAAALQLAKRGSVWQPIVRHFDVAGRTVKDGVFPIAATWLRTGAVDGPTAHCELVTGVQDPLTLQYDGRTEYLALAVTSTPSTGTALVCLNHGSPERPLAGLDVWLRDAGNHPARLVGQTDSNGTFRVTSFVPDVLMVYIRGGDDLLTRFPLVPGLESRLTVRLDDTGLRPESARFLAAARVAFLDIATQQRMLVARLKVQVANRQFDDAAETIATLRSLPVPEDFLKSLDTNRAKLTAVAADPTAAAWLDKRLEEFRTLAPTTLLSRSDLAKMESALAAMRRS